MPKKIPLEDNNEKRLKNIVPERSEMQKECERNGELLLAPPPWPNRKDQRHAHRNRTSPTDRDARLQRKAAN